LAIKNGVPPSPRRNYLQKERAGPIHYVQVQARRKHKHPELPKKYIMYKEEKI